MERRGLLVIPPGKAPTPEERDLFRTIVSEAGDVWQAPGIAFEASALPVGRLPESERAAFLAGWLSTQPVFSATHPEHLLPFAGAIIAFVEEKL